MVLEHSITEAQEVLDREVPKIKEDFRRAAEQGLQEEWYAALTQDQLPSMCIEVLREGTYANLEQLLKAAQRLPETLTQLGVQVRPHFNGEDHRVQQLHAALATQLASETGPTRSNAVIERDANTMAVAWRRRRKAKTGKWPGAWVVTKDRAMNPAYASLNSGDKVPLSITAGQWVTLLTVSASPVEVEELAKIAAEQFVDEAMWLLPARFPPDVAFDLARKLSPEHGGSETDMRVAQLTLDEALDWRDTSATLAGRVLSSRQRRVNDLAKLRAERISREVEDERP